MIKYIKALSFVVLIGLTMSSCDDEFLTSKPTASQAAGGDVTEKALQSNLAAAYQLLLFDSYANNRYESLMLTSDLRSDDIFKGGGDAADQGILYRLSQFQATPDETLEGLWSIYYTGLSRSNYAISAAANAVGIEEDDLAQYEAEGVFLRAYYTHWLWKYWGNIIYYEGELEPPYFAPQLEADEVYEEIIADLDYILEDDRLPMSFFNNPSEHGRVSKAAAMMLKARVVMYQKDQSRYAEVLSDMVEIIKSGDYQLMEDFSEIWLLEGEFGSESIFEVNHLPGEYGGKTWDSGWSGFGTNLPAFISPNSLREGTPDLLSGVDEFKGGWGFGPVRADVPAIYEAEDTRLAGSINEFVPDSFSVRFQNTNYFLAKYAAREEYNEPPGDVDLNYENNLRIFRYAETLLNAAELMVIHSVPQVDDVTAQWCMDQIRTRAGNLSSISPTADNIKLERRREFLGEGMRFWDVVRWGDTQLLNDDLPDFSSFRTWDESELYLPIPQTAINSTIGSEFEIVQNPY